jgi:hypothetical protein
MERPAGSARYQPACRLQGMACLRRDQFGDNPFVAVTPAILSPGCHFTLHGDEDFNHLHHAWGQFVTALKFFNLVFKTLFNVINRVIKRFGHRISISSITVVFIDSDLTPSDPRFVHQEDQLISAYHLF